MANANSTNANRYKGQDIDTEGDGEVDFAENSRLVKGQDIDTDGDGRVNAADTATTVKGNDIDTDGDGIVNEADHASSAGDADTVDGQHASDLGGSPRYLEGYAPGFGG